MSALPAVFRDAVLLRDVDDLSYVEIAAVLGIPEGTAMSRIHRGRALLRSALAGKGFGWNGSESVAVPHP